MDKRYIILGVALLALFIVGAIFAVSSCNKKPQTTELTLLTYQDEDALKEALKDYETLNSIKVNIVQKDPQNYELDSLNLISTGKVDVWGIPNNWLPKQHDKLAFRDGKSDITAYKALYPEVVQKDNIIDNKIYGYPLVADPLVMYVNSDLISAAKRGNNLSEADKDILDKKPLNWDDVAAQARLITIKSGDTVTTAGIALGTDDLAAAPAILTTLITQNGAQMTNDNNSEASFHTSVNKFSGGDYPGAKALDFYTGFADPNNPNFSFSQTFGDTTRAFAEGQIAYYIDFASKAKDIETINPELNYAVASLPQVRESQNPVNYIAYETFAVPNSSTDQTAAWDLIDYLNSEKILETFAKVSNKDLITDVESGENANAIKTALSWYNPDATAVDNIFRTSIAQVLQGVSAQTTLDSAALQVTDLLKKIGN